MDGNDKITAYGRCKCNTEIFAHMTPEMYHHRFYFNEIITCPICNEKIKMKKLPYTTRVMGSTAKIVREDQ